MIVDRLICHHTYRGTTAFDLSGNGNHGETEGLVSVGGGIASFDGGEDCVRVPVSESLSSLRAVRVSVTFRWTPEPLMFPKRFNLVEGYLSFALMIERIGENPAGQLSGSILDRTGTWRAIQSDPYVVTPGYWHTAVFVHDGISSCRLDLDGVTVAEAFDVPGPVSGVHAHYGLAIGHWPDPDARYTFAGEISEFQLWKDRPEAIRDAADLCCCTETARADDAFAHLREGHDTDAHVHAAEELYDVGSRAFGLMASGGATERNHAHDLARRFALAVTSQDLQAMQDAIAAGAVLSTSTIPANERTELTDRMVNALRQTVIGPFLDAALNGGLDSTEAIETALANTGLDVWLRGFCFEWAVDQRDPAREPQRPADHPGRDNDPTVDRPPDEQPPGWEAGPRHDNGAKMSLRGLPAFRRGRATPQ
ncbi:LamG domain-containing protein [Aldersonia sp. NBC_00410]|uniref:LamG-like jellyroll fold domain-containing protein n=1 Tax=Aldersonia sp. NBC_00410 TaxID=2975954 RepID=UPI002252B12A|nr:LamG-like jellyroll fold domain-containing protein [Aldersonia sp. NBC_00410]MCX5046303.1 LamG domain-containing protein [Aldersonia sp. NBC_00410]